MTLLAQYAHISGPAGEVEGADAEASFFRRAWLIATTLLIQSMYGEPSQRIESVHEIQWALLVLLKDVEENDMSSYKDPEKYATRLESKDLCLSVLRMTQGRRNSSIAAVPGIEKQLLMSLKYTMEITSFNGILLISPSPNWLWRSRSKLPSFIRIPLLLHPPNWLRSSKSKLPIWMVTDEQCRYVA